MGEKKYLCFNRTNFSIKIILFSISFQRGFNCAGLFIHIVTLAHTKIDLRTHTYTTHTQRQRDTNPCSYISPHTTSVVRSIYSAREWNYHVLQRWYNTENEKKNISLRALSLSPSISFFPSFSLSFSFSGHNYLLLCEYCCSIVAVAIVFWVVVSFVFTLVLYTGDLGS